MAIWNKKDEAPTPPSSSPAARLAPTPAPASPSGPVASSKGGSVLGAGLKVEGRLTGGEDVRLEGHFSGEVHLPRSQVTVARGGDVKANLTAETVLIEGKVEGDVRGTERVVVRQGATIEGNIAAPRVILEDGCRVTGSIDMTGSKDQTGSGNRTGASDRIGVSGQTGAAGPKAPEARTLAGSTRP